MADIEPTPLDLTWGSFTENGPWNVDREQLAWMRGIRVLRLATRRQVPELTASFSPTLLGSFAGRKWSLRTDVIYTGSMYGDYSKLNLIPANTRVNLRLTTELTKSIQMELYGTNVFDELAFPATASTLVGPTRGTQADRTIFTGLPQRRTFGIRVNASF